MVCDFDPQNVEPCARRLEDLEKACGRVGVGGFFGWVLLFCLFLHVFFCVLLCIIFVFVRWL